MSAVIYIASPRAPLVNTSPVHVAATQYSIDVKLQAYSTTLDQPKTQHVSLAANVETVLQRISKVLSVTFIWPNSLNADMEEFLFSIAGGESFSFDPYGTVASADDPLTVVSTTGNISIANLIPRNPLSSDTPYRSASLTLRPVP